MVSRYLGIWKKNLALCICSGSLKILDHMILPFPSMCVYLFIYLFWGGG